MTPRSVPSNNIESPGLKWTVRGGQEGRLWPPDLRTLMACGREASAPALGLS